MNYEAKNHSSRSTLALVLAVVSLVLAVALVAVNHYETTRVLELEERWRKQHEELVGLRSLTERLAGKNPPTH
jgi:hypothetical protein